MIAPVSTQSERVPQNSQSISASKPAFNHAENEEPRQQYLGALQDQDSSKINITTDHHVREAFSLRDIVLLPCQLDIAAAKVNLIVWRLGLP